MEPSVEKTGDLGRRLVLHLDATDVRREVDSTLAKIGKNYRLKGFRAGKVPIKEIKRRFGKTTFREVIEKQVGSRFNDLAKKNGLSVAGAVRFGEPNEKEEAFEVECVFEELPILQPPTWGEKTVTLPEVEVSEDDVDAAIENMRAHHADYLELDRAAKEGDRVDVSVFATCEGQPAIGSASAPRELSVFLGEEDSQSFADHFRGRAKGDQCEFEFDASDDMPEQLRGKKLSVNAAVQAVKERKLPQLDEAFAEKVGLKWEDEQNFRSQIKKLLEERGNTLAEFESKNILLGTLVSASGDFPVPESLVRAELESELRRRISQAGANPSAISEVKVKQEAEDMAKQKVRMGLAVRAFAEREGIKPEPNKVSALLGSMPKPEVSGKDAQEIRRQQAVYAEAVALEEAIVEKIKENVEIKFEKKPFKDLERSAA